MNILFFHNNGIIPTSGGVSRITWNLYKLFRKNGNQVWIISAKDIHKGVKYDDRQFFLPNAEQANTISNFDYLSSFIIKNDIQFIINQAATTKDVVDLLWKCGQQTKAKVINCFHNSILTPVYNFAYTREFELTISKRRWLFSLMKLPIVKQVLVPYYIHQNRSLYLNTINKSDAVLLLCEGQLKELKRMCNLSECKKAFVIPNCVPYGEICDEQKKQIVLWVGSFDYAIKRPDNMLRIWQQVSSNHPEWVLYMLGDGPSFETIKKMAEQNGIVNIHFTGRVNPDEYYNESEILCLTSVHESFSLVLVEAMQHRMAVIAFDSFTAAKYIINDNYDGILVKAFDIKSYADALKRLMEDEQERKRIQTGTSYSVSRFSGETVYKHWTNLFNVLINQ